VSVRPRRRLTLALLGCAALMACRSAPLPAVEPGPTAPVPSSAQVWAAQYAKLAAAGGTLLHLDPRRSTVRILVFRGGRAPKLGHNHVLAAPDFTGYLFVPAAGAADARFDLEFRLDRLDLDDPRIRATLGPAFAAGLTPGDIANTRAHMLGDDNLQADRYPYVRIRSLQITGEGPAYAAQVEVEMHGRRRAQWLALTAEGLPQRLALDGSFVLRQSDFGVHPYSALGGLIAVQDEVLVRFSLVGN
jgi:polyisoprenoid-binding protein YceI